MKERNDTLLGLEIFRIVKNIRLLVFNLWFVTEPVILLHSSDLLPHEDHRVTCKLYSFIYIGNKVFIACILVF
jgi:hypothetical protein